MGEGGRGVEVEENNVTVVKLELRYKSGSKNIVRAFVPGRRDTFSRSKKYPKVPLAAMFRLSPAHKNSK